MFRVQRFMGSGVQGSGFKGSGFRGSGVPGSTFRVKDREGIRFPDRSAKSKIQP
jgi:hypothetical protein